MNTIVSCAAALAILAANLFFVSAYMPEFSNLAFKSCKWIEHSLLATTRPTTTPLKRVSVRKPDESTGINGAPWDDSDCWKVYSGYPIDCPRHNPFRWSWLGRFDRPVGLQRMVVKGTLLNSDGGDQFLPAGITVIAQPWDANQPQRDCRLDQAGGSLGIFDCSGGGPGTKIGALLVGVRRTDETSKTTPSSKLNEESVKGKRCIGRVPVCGIRVFDVGSQLLKFLTCRHTLRSDTSSTTEKSTACQSVSIFTTDAANAFDWRGEFGRSAKIGRVFMDACPTSASTTSSPSVEPVEETVCQSIEVSTGKHRCNKVENSNSSVVASFDCGGSEANALTVRGSRSSMKDEPSQLFELCNVVAYGVETSGYLPGSSRYRK